MQEIQDVINAKVKAMVDENVIIDAINESVEKAVITALQRQFESYGNITKQITDSLEKGLQIDISQIPLESYNQQMLVMIKNKINSVFMDMASEKFIAAVEDALQPAPKEMTIHSFIESIVEMWKVDSEDGCYCTDEVDNYATVELNKSSYGSYSLEMWKKKKSTGYSSLSTARELSSDVSLYISTEGKIRINHRKGYNPTCMHGEDALIFKLFAAGTVLTDLETFDPDDVDLSLTDDY